MIIIQSLKSIQGPFVEKPEEKRPLGVVNSILAPLGTDVSSGALRGGDLGLTYETTQ